MTLQKDGHGGMAHDPFGNTTPPIAAKDWSAERWHTYGHICRCGECTLNAARRSLYSGVCRCLACDPDGLHGPAEPVDTIAVPLGRLAQSEQADRDALIHLATTLGLVFSTARKRQIHSITCWAHEVSDALCELDGRSTLTDEHHTEIDPEALS